MISLLNPILAQAATTPEEVTVGGIITAIMFLLTVTGSVAMVIVWILRYGQSGHALPAARRGVLRIPWGLTLFASALSVLFIALNFVVSIAATNPAASSVVPPPASASNVDEILSDSAKATDVSTEDAGDTGNSTSDETEAATGKQTKPPEAVTPATEATSVKAVDSPAKAPDASKINPEVMEKNLLFMIAMDVVILLSFGAVILIAGKAGRVYLTNSSSLSLQTALRSTPMFVTPAGTVGTGREYGSPWPDLDDASAIPQMRGYDILGGRSDASLNPIQAIEHSPETTSSLSALAQHFDSVERNQNAIDGEHDAADPNAIVASSDESHVPDEVFSFTRELRFAAEVFLAAYLPTMVLKFLILLISFGIYGEKPKSHPFLEMLDDGVSVSMIAMILIMAVFVAPVVEELQFRVVMLGGIAQHGWSKLALIVSSILFGFAHGFPDSIALLPLAFALGYTYLRRRSYVTVMLVHFLFNGFNMILALAALM